MKIKNILLMAPAVFLFGLYDWKALLLVAACLMFCWGFVRTFD